MKPARSTRSVDRLSVEVEQSGTPARRGIVTSVLAAADTVRPRRDELDDRVERRHRRLGAVARDGERAGRVGVDDGVAQRGSAASHAPSAPQNASPAPTVSTTGTEWALTSKMPSSSATTQPSPPTVMTTDVPIQSLMDLRRASVPSSAICVPASTAGLASRSAPARRSRPRKRSMLPRGGAGAGLRTTTCRPPWRSLAAASATSIDNSSCNSSTSAERISDPARSTSRSGVRQAFAREHDDDRVLARLLDERNPDAGAFDVVDR